MSDDKKGPKGDSIAAMQLLNEGCCGVQITLYRVEGESIWVGACDACGRDWTLVGAHWSLVMG